MDELLVGAARPRVGAVVELDRSALHDGIAVARVGNLDICAGSVVAVG